MEMIDVTEKKELNWNELGFAYMETVSSRPTTRSP